MKRTILLVEDETNLAHGLKLNFEIEGFEVTWAPTMADARRALQQRPILVILDLMLPDGSGFDLLQEIKRNDVRQPVLVLTARATDEDRIAGLSFGADDYVTKPFNLQELVLRARNIARRSDWYREPVPDEIRIDEGVLFPSKSTYVRQGSVRLLTELELNLLLHLWKKRGSFVSREELLVEVWGYSPDTATRTVDIFISRLRRVLEAGDDSPRVLVTRRGQGYMLAVE